MFGSFVFVSARLLAAEVKATRAQSPESETSKVGPSACLPVEETETRVIAPVSRLRTNASATPLLSPGTRFDASEMNARQCGERFFESPSTAGRYERPFAGCPPMPVEPSSVWPPFHGVPSLPYGSARRMKNTSVAALMSPATRSGASDSNATTFAMRWSWLIAGLREGPFGTVPESDFESRYVVASGT